MQSRNYNAGSVIYFEGDKPEFIYILKKGTLQSISTSVETGLETRKNIALGEFFGMKSLLAATQQEETIQCTTDCLVIQITAKEFEDLACKNVQIIVKMMKVFSNQLRDLGKQIMEVVGSDDVPRDPVFEMYNMAQAYFKNKKYKYALYAYQKYIDMSNGEGKFCDSATAKISECKIAMKGE